MTTTVWRMAAARLRDTGIATPELDARLLLAHAAGISHANVISATDDTLTADVAERYGMLIERRLAGEPVSRIVGQRGFWAHDFLVTPDTLDPRPDSETLIELVLRIVEHETWRNQNISILDIGTGTGCLLLSLLAELPDARGTGTDVSADALATARQNSERLALLDRAAFVEASWTQNIEGSFDIIISNPPYIPTADIEELMDEVRLHDPRVALDGGPDGLSAYREIIGDARRLQPSGWLVFEVGQGQDRDVAALLEAYGYDVGASELTFAADLGGIVRCVAGRVR